MIPFDRGVPARASQHCIGGAGEYLPTKHRGVHVCVLKFSAAKFSPSTVPQDTPKWYHGAAHIWRLQDKILMPRVSAKTTHTQLLICKPCAAQRRQPKAKHDNNAQPCNWSRAVRSVRWGWAAWQVCCITFFLGTWNGEARCSIHTIPQQVNSAFARTAKSAAAPR